MIIIIFRVVLHSFLLESCNFSHLRLMLFLDSQLGLLIAEVVYLILASMHGKDLGFWFLYLMDDFLPTPSA